MLRALGIEKLGPNRYQVYGYGGYFVVPSIWVALRIRLGL